MYGWARRDLFIIGQESPFQTIPASREGWCELYIEIYGWMNIQRTILGPLVVWEINSLLAIVHSNFHFKSHEGILGVLEDLPRDHSKYV